MTDQDGGRAWRHQGLLASIRRGSGPRLGLSKSLRDGIQEC